MCDFLTHYLKGNENISHSTPFFFFFRTLAREKPDEGTLREKDFSASFLEIEVLLCHPIDLPVCRSNTYLPFPFGDTHVRHSPHLILPLLPRFPNIL